MNSTPKIMHDGESQDDQVQAGTNQFNLFTHQRLQQEGKKIEMTYENLKVSLLELYLSVKIRSDDEIDGYNENMFSKEKKAMSHIDGFTLIDYIKSSIEILMNMKLEENN
jgi:hypothetical protein